MRNLIPALILTVALSPLAPNALAQPEIGQIGCLDDGSNCTEYIYGLGYDPEVDSVQIVVQRANPARTDCLRHAGSNPVNGQIVIRERTDAAPGDPIDVEIPLQDEIIGLNGVATDARSFWSLQTRSYQTAAFLGAARLDNFGVVYVEGARGRRLPEPALGPDATRIDWDADGPLGTCSVSDTPCSHSDFCPLNSDRICERSTDELGAPLPCGPGVGSCPDDGGGAQGCLLNVINDEFCMLGTDQFADLIPHAYFGASCCDSTSDVLCPLFDLPEYPFLASRRIFTPVRYITDFLFPFGGAGTDFRSEEETYPGQRWGICESNGSRFGELGDPGCSAPEIPSVCSGVPDISICNTTSDCVAANWPGECVPRSCSDQNSTCQIRMIGLNFGEEGTTSSDPRRATNVTDADGTPNANVCQNEGVHFVGSASSKCAIPQEVWFGPESGPAPDPTAYCVLANYGFEARPDTDCDGAIDGPDLCPEIIEANPLLDGNGDGVGTDCQCGDPNATGFYEAADLFRLFMCLLAPEPTGSCRVNADVICTVDSDCPLFDPDNDPATPPIETCSTLIPELAQPCLGFLPQGGKGVAKSDTNNSGAIESADLMGVFVTTPDQDGTALDCLLRTRPLLGTCATNSALPCSVDAHCPTGVCVPTTP